MRHVLGVYGIGSLLKDPVYCPLNNSDRCKLLLLFRASKSEQDYSMLVAYAWGRAARDACSWLDKGDHLLVEGHVAQMHVTEEGRELPQHVTYLRLRSITFIPKGSKPTGRKARQIRFAQAPDQEDHEDARCAAAQPDRQDSSGGGSWAEPEGSA